MAFLLLVGLVLWVLVDWTVDELRPRYLESMEESMIDTATILSSLIQEKMDDDLIDTDDLRTAFNTARQRRFRAKIYQVTKSRLSMRVYVVDSTGIVVFDSNDGQDEGKDYSKWNDIVLTMRGEYGARTSRINPDDPTSSVLYVGSPIISGDEIIGVLTVCKPIDSVTLFMEMARKKMIVAGLVAGLIVVAFGIVISSWITWPIQKLTDYAKAIRDGRRVNPPQLGRSEIGQLGSAFEEMREAVEGRQYVENYVQTLTHEMKSPLSAIRGAAELLEEDMPLPQKTRFIENIRAESARIQDLVDRLLQLSAIEKRRELRDVEEIDIAALLQDVSESADPIASAKNITMDIHETEHVSIRGEQFLVRQAIANLLQNAIEFSSVGGNIQLSLSMNGEQVLIRVSDEGSGIPDYAGDRIFDRFYSLRRPDTGKKSSGLGLTFVREVASLHGGQVKIESNSGAGNTATLVLPGTPPRAVS